MPSVEDCGEELPEVAARLVSTSSAAVSVDNKLALSNATPAPFANISTVIVSSEVGQ